MIVKVGRNEYDLTEDDEILYNGTCYQITTRKVRDGWFTHSAVLAKGKAEKMIKEGLLIVKKVRDEKFPLIVYKIKS